MWAERSAVASSVVNSAYVYGNSINYGDITSGNNGAPCLLSASIFVRAALVGLALLLSN